MMQIHEYLSQYREGIPGWLAGYQPGDDLKFADVVSGRISYYPGFGEDGTLLKVGNMSHAVHSHILLDYLNDYEEDLAQVNAITGYASIGHIEWDIEDILPNGLYPHNVDYKFHTPPDTFKDGIKPHFFTEILERKDSHGESHGARRMAVSIMRADGIDFYYQLFVREYHNVPWLFLLQDHGLGCNYDAFGKGGFLDAIMQKNLSFPEFVITDNRQGTRIWDGYGQITDAEAVKGGMHDNIRGLWKRQDFLGNS